MSKNAMTLLASGITLATGAFWGLYWLPVRGLADAGLQGAWGTLAITIIAVMIIAPFAVFKRVQFAGADIAALAFTALGGAAFALYSIGFLYGRVGMIILLWFFSPVWSTLIARYVMGWETPASRLASIGVGIVGLMILLGAGGTLPFPKGLGEWMSLFGGILWSVSTTGIRARPNIGSVASTIMFSGGAALAGLVLAPLLEPWSPVTTTGWWSISALVILTAGFWWVGSIAALLWAVQRIDPARVAILLMSEVLVGAISASIFAHETLQPLEIAGGILVVGAGVLEIWPTRKAA